MLEEFIDLVCLVGVIIVVILIVCIDCFNLLILIGFGKLDEIKVVVEVIGVDLVLVNYVLLLL